MKRVLITGAGSYIGTKVENWLKQWPELFQVDAVDTINDNWKKADFTKYDVVYNVAGIAHVKAAKGEGPLYYADEQAEGCQGKGYIRAGDEENREDAVAYP